jgi:4-hydroxy-2-oxoheptanedioate aldolase
VDLPLNTFKAALARGDLQIGLWSSLCSSIAAEVVAYSGFEWILIDTEHSPNEPLLVLAQLQAMQAGRAAPIVRPAWNDLVLIKRSLDLGAQTLLIPFVQTAEEAQRAVASCRYPPAGIRGITTTSRGSCYGRITDYLERANAEICVLVQIETREALEEVEAIASVEGVDGVFIGPADLSASLGHIGDPRHPEVQAAIEDAAKRLTALGKPAGILGPTEAEARRYIEWGYRFVAVGSDLGLLAKNADALAKAFKPARKTST